MSGVHEGEGGGTIPRAPKSPNNVASTFFNTVHLLPKDPRFEHGGAKLVSCPGRHLTSSRPCWQATPFALWILLAVLSGHFYFKQSQINVSRTQAMQLWGAERVRKGVFKMKATHIRHID